MYGGAVSAGQAVKANGRLIPFVHLHAFHVVQQFAAVQYWDRIAKAERFGVSCILLLCGLRDRVSRRGPEVRYAGRRLLGVNKESIDLTLDILHRYLRP
ncbi:hypothetical protein D3C81_1993750 [compost metagenome]